MLEWNKVPAKRRPLDPIVREQIIERLRDGPASTAGILR